MTFDAFIRALNTLAMWIGYGCIVCTALGVVMVVRYEMGEAKRRARFQELNANIDRIRQG